jgi:hypothetical protein
MDTRARTYVDYLISCAHDIFVMLDNYDSIAEIDEFTEIINQKSTISRMKTYRRLI